MTSEIEAIKIKQVRRVILGNLGLVYPSAMQLDALYRTVCPANPDYEHALFVKDIYYLAEKGYIEFVDDKIGGLPFRKKFAKLTAEGKEIAEQTMTDKALEI